MEWLDKKNMVAASDRGDFEAFSGVVDRNIASFDRQDWELFLFCLSLVDVRHAALCRRHRSIILAAAESGTFEHMSFGAMVRAGVVLDRLSKDSS